MERNIKLIITKKNNSIYKSFCNFDFIKNKNIVTYKTPKYFYINDILNDCKTYIIKYSPKYILIILVIYLLFI